jgi:hypothetical protein
MAQQVKVQLLDDLDGSEADETVEFALDGVSYTIDLSSDHAGDLRDGLAQYVEAAKRTGGRKKRTGKRDIKATEAPARGQAAANREQTQAIREWARSTGYEVSARGRIPSHIAEAYEKAHRSRRRA